MAAAAAQAQPQKTADEDEAEPQHGPIPVEQLQVGLFSLDNSMFFSWRQDLPFFLRFPGSFSVLPSDRIWLFLLLPRSGFFLSLRSRADSRSIDLQFMLQTGISDIWDRRPGRKKTQGCWFMHCGIRGLHSEEGSPADQRNQRGQSRQDRRSWQVIFPFYGYPFTRTFMIF